MVALRACKDCGTMISPNAKVCPNCGAPPRKRTSVFSWLIVGLMVFGVYKCTTTLQQIEGDPKRAEKAAAAIVSAATGTPEIPARSQYWVYTSDPDAVTGKTWKFGQILSVNSLSLGFPYQGVNHGELTVRSHPQQGTAVYVAVNKGQIICRSMDGCQIRVRFDEGAPQNFTGREPTDHSSNTLFLLPAAKFITAASKAGRIIVELTMYQEGNQVLTFEPKKPLAWPPV